MNTFKVGDPVRFIDNELNLAENLVGYSCHNVTSELRLPHKNLWVKVFRMDKKT